MSLEFQIKKNLIYPKNNSKRPKNGLWLIIKINLSITAVEPVNNTKTGLTWCPSLLVLSECEIIAEKITF
jgi:hypothetical protein